MSAAPSANATSKSSSAPGPRHRPGRLANLWVTLISVLCIALLIFLMEVWLGHVSGVEFDPVTFQTRTFQYYEIPLLHIQITPVRRKTRSPQASVYLSQNNLLQPGGPSARDASANTPPAAGPPSGADSKIADSKIDAKNHSVGQPAATPWHLVSVNRGRSRSEPADAALLVDQLMQHEDGSSVWKAWSQDHPKLAAIVWPRIATLAQRELYLLIPGLMWEIRGCDDPDAMSGVIDGYLQTEMVDLVSDMRASDRDELADALLAEALLDYPDHEPLLALRNP